jgi:aminomethyltransferase
LRGDGRGRPCLISRTGYTGEDGFELYHAAGDAPALAEALLAAGQAHGLELCGLGARDSLRLEAGYPLYGHELTREISPLTAGLGWTVKLDKGCDFAGRAALAAEKRGAPRRKVVFFKTGDRRIVRPETPVSGRTARRSAGSSRAPSPDPERGHRLGARRGGAAAAAHGRRPGQPDRLAARQAPVRRAKEAL